MSPQLRSGGGGGMHTVGYSAAHTAALRVGVGVVDATMMNSVGVGVRLVVGDTLGVRVAVAVSVENTGGTITPCCC
jgi:hypothetical protein